MCGITGLISQRGLASSKEFQLCLQKMNSLQKRRGPDDERTWVDSRGRATFGFTRLAILDRTPAGAQPMESHDGRSVLVFNGEIYNFQDLRKQLSVKGISFRSQSDSEVLLEALNLWGKEALQKLNGMFALAWYQKESGELLLARDHAGIKPLYYSIHEKDGDFAFASQFNSLLYTPFGPPGELDPEVLRLYLQLHHIPPPYSLLKNTYQLEPGEFIQRNAEGLIRKGHWWSLPRHSNPPQKEADPDQFLEILQGVIQRQRIADVPLGTFLSSGVDSSLITAITGSQTHSNLKAFILGNPGWDQDESAVAMKNAKSLELEGRLETFLEADMDKTVEDAIQAQYEPFADYSILPTLHLSSFARREVTAILSGDGADEIFYGYERPFSLLRGARDFHHPYAWRMALYYLGKMKLGRPRSTATTYADAGAYYFDVNCRLKPFQLRKWMKTFPGLPDDFNLYSSKEHHGKRGYADYSRWVEFYGQMQRCLKKVDMASMRHSLEIRVPFLDRELLEWSLSVNQLSAINKGIRKPILKQALEKLLPDREQSDSKLGFSVPLAEWLRGGLRERVHDTFHSIPMTDFFYGEKIRSYWEQHLSGERDHKWGVWTFLSLFWWFESHYQPALRWNKNSSEKEMVPG